MAESDDATVRFLSKGALNNLSTEFRENPCIVELASILLSKSDHLQRVSERQRS